MNNEAINATCGPNADDVTRRMVADAYLRGAQDVAESLRELTDWMRENLGPRDGIHGMLCRAVERLERLAIDAKEFKRGASDEEMRDLL